MCVASAQSPKANGCTMVCHRIKHLVPNRVKKTFHCLSFFQTHDVKTPIGKDKAHGGAFNGVDLKPIFIS